MMRPGGTCWGWALAMMRPSCAACPLVRCEITRGRGAQTCGMWHACGRARTTRAGSRAEAH
eukprot:2066677-Prymnesium_polylepis.1